MSDFTPSSVGRRIRELRKARGWSAQKLADLIEVNGGTLGRSGISDLEVGRIQSPRFAEAVSIAKAFGLSLDQFADFETPTSAFVIAAEIADAKHRLDAALSGGDS